MSHYHHHPSYYEDATSRISPEDLHYLAQTQRHLARHEQHPHSGYNRPPSGEGSSSSSHPSRRSSTTGRSAGGPTLSLDPQALTQLSAHFEGLLQSIAARVEYLSAQTMSSTQAHHRRTQRVADHATMEIERLREIMRQCDELQNEFLKIKRIGEIVKGFRQRVELLEQRIGR